MKELKKSWLEQNSENSKGIVGWCDRGAAGRIEEFWKASRKDLESSPIETRPANSFNDEVHAPRHKKQKEMLVDVDKIPVHVPAIGRLIGRRKTPRITAGRPLDRQCEYISLGRTPIAMLHGTADLR